LTLPELLLAYARGDTGAQHAVLEEVEPLLFGMARSLVPAGPDAHARAVDATHALTLAFHLRACAGGVDLADARALRAFAHRAAVAKLADKAPLLLAEGVADEETASLVYACLGVGLTVEAELSGPERECLIARLEGRPADESGWRDRLVRARLIR
jgi:hypothetical protein